MFLRNRILLCSLASLACLSSTLHAQTTGTQNFTVSVPSSISITAPTAASITHDQTDNPQAFPAQTWLVKGNNLAGVNVTFETGSAFVHATDNSFKRNAKLDLAVGTTQGPATWTVGTATDTTNYASNDGVAQVTASSNGVGRANLNLTVSFLTEEFGTFAAGNYVTTVTGTVAAR
jgi:hypothetical protein